MNPIVSRPSRALFMALLGTASFLTTARSAAAQVPPAQTAQASPDMVPEHPSRPNTREIRPGP